MTAAAGFAPQSDRLVAVQRETLSPLETLSIALSKAIDAVNESINAVKTGDEKIDPDGRVSELLELCTANVMDQHDALSSIEGITPQTNRFSEELRLIRKLREHLSLVFDLSQDLAYRIRIRDAMTEQGSKSCGIPEFDALNDP